MQNRKITLKMNPFSEYWVTAKPTYGGEVTFRNSNLGHRYEILHMPPHFCGCTRMSCGPMCIVGEP